jgi:hypothetical protein
MGSVRHVIRPVADVDIGDLRSDLVTIGRAVDLTKDRSAGVMLAIAHTATIDPEFARSIHNNMAEPFIGAMRDVIGKAIARGQLRPQAQDLMYAPDVLPSLALAGGCLAQRSQLMAKRCFPS